MEPIYWFSNEHGKRVEVIAVVENWCMVKQEDKKKPYCLALEYVEAIAGTKIIRPTKQFKHNSIMLTGLQEIRKERIEQINKHGRTIERDIMQNGFAQLVDAAMCLLMTKPRKEPPSNWQQAIWDKMISKPYRERVIIAGALLAAEIDRNDCVGWDSTKDEMRKVAICSCAEIDRTAPPGEPCTACGGVMPYPGL